MVGTAKMHRLTTSGVGVMMAAMKKAPATERTARAEQQLDIARARVLSGAAVQTDSLQLLLELTRARIKQIQDDSLRKLRQMLRRGVQNPNM